MKSVHKTGKRPAFQFYPRDWLNDPALRLCSLPARGLWIDLLSIMHDGEPYGHLSVKQQPIPLAGLATRVGVSTKQLKKLLEELHDRGVYSVSSADIIYSRRMVRDEHNREVRAAGGPKSLDNPKVPRPKEGGEGILFDEPKDTSLPSPAVAVAVASASKRERHPAGAGFELLSKSDCDLAFERWSAKLGAISYSRFRKALLTIRGSEAGREVTTPELLDGIEAFSEWYDEQPDRDQRFITIEKDFSGQIHRWVRLGKMPLAVLGELTERGAIIGTKGLRGAA